MYGKTKRTVTIAAASLAALGTAGAAVAATQDDSPAGASKTIVASAAQEVGVTPAALASALVKAEEAQIDVQVTAGKLTQAQADAWKKRLESGDVPLVGIGFGHGGPGGRHGGPGRGGHDLATVASYVGETAAQVRTELASGKTLAQIATAHGKTVDGLVASIVAAEKTHLDAGVAAGKLTQAQEDAILKDATSRVTDMVNGRWPTRPADGSGPGAPSQTTTSTTTTTSS